MQSLAESSRQLEYSLISGKNDDVPRRIEDGRADFTMIEVPLHIASNVIRQRRVKILREELPNMLTIQDHGIHLRF